MKRLPFKPLLAQRIEQGGKTETRRICRRISHLGDSTYQFDVNRAESITFDAEDRTLIQLALLDHCPYSLGEELLIAEQHWRAPRSTRFKYHDELTPDEARSKGFRLQAARYMRSEWCRRTVIVTHRDLQQLSSIDDGAAHREGIPLDELHARRKFLQLWDSIHRMPPDRVLDNPWLWVVRFSTPDTK